MGRKPDLSIIDKTFNDLHIDTLTDQYSSYGKAYYSCTCLICGRKRLATKADLIRGKVKNCGNHHEYNDITGKIFGILKAIEVVDDLPQGEKVSRWKEKTKIWKCECLRCGKIKYVSYYNLKNGKVNSCECSKMDMSILSEYGTNPSLLKRKEPPVTNTSGSKGVSYCKARGKWEAYITFRKKRYHLGRYIDKKDAIAARKEAEERIFGDFLEWYEAEHQKEKNNEG